MNDVVNKLKSMGDDSYFISELEKKQIEQYARELALMDTFNEGRDEGKKAKQMEIAKNMLSKTEDLQFISDVTGLSIKEINDLK